jgi:hypothetical protein
MTFFALPILLCFPASLRYTDILDGDTFTPRLNSTETRDSPSPTFGDISMIAPIGTDATTTMHIVHDDRGMGYIDLHKGDINDAIDRLKANAISSFPRRKTLSHVLSTPGMICNLPTNALPRPIKHGPIQPGTQLTIDSCNGVVDLELRRNSSRVEFILKEDGQFDAGPIVVKAQSPIGSLAWEYEILRKVEERIQQEDLKSVLRLPYPKALSFVAFTDGATLTMSTGSTSRLSLIDLNNLYTKLGEEIPEILALHYTARMLHHLELLHWHAKVLVSTVTCIHFPSHFIVFF